MPDGVVAAVDVDVIVVAINAVYIPLSEEPGLVKRFGEEYEVYRRNVPRWIPTLKPWPADRTKLGQRCMGS